ncbi:MAG: TIGR04442 family protein [Acidobacteria bacterium]|nr:TIGR04442 family protein [Acidobacteriota bacterium]
MIQDIRLHGYVIASNERYEYFTNIVGPGVYTHFFYEQGKDNRGTNDRFFLSGNEIIIYSDRIYHQGNGGTFCEYMLGMDLPIKDVLKPDIHNRLVMYGAKYDERGERIIFTNNTTGQDTISRIFEEGHAFANYYFFIAGDIQGDGKTVQETLLRFTGKILKRVDLSSDLDGFLIAKKLYQEIGISRWTVFIIKLIDRYALDYYNKFSDIYQKRKSNLSENRESLEILAKQYKLSQSERTRLELDVIQKHPDNVSLVNNYKEVLALYSRKPNEETLLFKRNRIRTLASCQQIPAQLFDNLEQMLNHQAENVVLPDFVSEMQEHVKNLLSDSSTNQLTESDLRQLLQARAKALLQHYAKFDDILMELGKGYGGEKAQLFSIIVAHLERFQSAYEIINSVAFIDDYKLIEEQLYLLARTQDVIDNIKIGFFDELIFRNIARQYLNRYGQERLSRLKNSLQEIIIGEVMPSEIIKAIEKINSEARLRRLIDGHLRESVRDIYKEPLTKVEQEALRKEISGKLQKQGLINDLINSDLFATAIFALREEYLYLNDLLPQIVNNRDRQLRDDFLENSDLDRFRTEELEQQYFRSYKVSSEMLEWFAKEIRG